MLVVKRYATYSQLLEFLRGTFIISAKVGTNTAGSPNFGETATGAFANVLVDDTIHISGDATAYAVITATDANNVILNTNIPAAHTNTAIWRAYRGGVDPGSIIIGPIPDPHGEGSGFLVYDKVDFAN